MIITFSIHYQTSWGQVLMLSGSHPLLGNWDFSSAVELFAHGDGRWEHRMQFEGPIEGFEYKYYLVDRSTDVRFDEWGPNRRFIAPAQAVQEYTLVDHWRLATRPENALYTSAFTSAIFSRSEKAEKIKALAPKKGLQPVRLQLINARVEPSHYVAVVGELEALGAWDFAKHVPMQTVGFPLWTTELLVPSGLKGFSYKYCVVDRATKHVVLAELNDRYFELPATGAACLSDEYFEFPRLPWKGAGVAIPVFSIRSNDSFGVGEFADLKLMVDWAKRTGLKMIQILPINDTVATHTWVDSYPYAAISVFALHPIYLRVTDLGEQPAELTAEIFAQRQQLLNSLDKIDYEAVMRTKSRYIKLSFDAQRDRFLASAAFRVFFEQNQDWLRPYAAFSYLRDLYGTAEFAAWGRFRVFSTELLDELTDPSAAHYNDIAVHYFIQYHLHVQLLEAANYARANHIVLKGDIPIGIYRNSVDAWTAPHLYNMHSQAGAPPDDFSDLGQNWRFPTYNWAEMAKDGFLWWRQRLSKMATYFDAYRIDHILGFFRIWEIEGDQRLGILGRFNPALAIHRNEIAGRGVAFDYLRFCRPYIRQHMLYPLFGEQTDAVKQHYLVEYQPGCFYFKPEFDTQEKVENYLAVGPEASQAEKANKEFLRNGLFYLHSEVLFLEAPFSNGEAFHPRHSMYKTWSFQELDGHAQQQLMELYNDFFYRRNEEFWRNQAMVKLPAIKQATNMLVCGEDLGMVPDCVPSVMNDLGILSLEVQRMPKNPKIEFGHPADYPYLSVATPSSHDTSTIRGWWEEDSSRSQRFYSTILGKWGGSPFFADPWLVKEIVVQHIYSPSMWAVFPIQDLLGMDGRLRAADARSERINEPANPTHYWRYRLHLPMETLLKEDEFNDLVLNMMKDSGRYWSY